MTIARKVLFSGEGSHGKYQVVEMVYDGRPARMLYGDDSSPQSGMALDDNLELLFDYNQRFLEMVASLRPKNILVIGGGVFMLPTAVYRRFSDTHIDVVEIDSLLVKLAERYFNLPDDPRLQIHVQDGKEYMKASQQKYDMIIMDAFSGFTIPHHLLDDSAISLYKSHLNPGGVMAINFISKFAGRSRWMAHEIVDSFSDAFGYSEIYQADPFHPKNVGQNLLYVASDKEVNFDYLQSSGVLHSMFF